MLKAISLLITLMILAVPTANAKSSKHTTSDKVHESTKVIPHITYRTGSLQRREESVYHNETEHKNWVDQLYLDFHFSRSYNFRHDVVLEPTIRTKRNRPNDLEYLIEQGYLKMQLAPWLTLTTGKKSEFDGSGFLFAPSDLLNENKDIFDSLYQREGKYFTRFTTRFAGHSLGLGVIPMRGQDVEEAKAWAQLSSDIWDIDVRMQYTSQKQEKSTVGLSLSRFFGGSFELHMDGRYQAKQRQNTEPNLSLREREFSAYQNDDSSSMVLAGSRIVFTPKRTLILEGLTNASGLLPEEFEEFYKSELYVDDEMTEKREGKNVLEPDSRILGRHYAFVSYQDDDSIKKTHLAFSYCLNTDDQSYFLISEIRHYLSPITTIELTPMIFQGEANTEFGEMPFSMTAYLAFKGRF